MPLAQCIACATGACPIMMGQQIFRELTMASRRNSSGAARKTEGMVYVTDVPKYVEERARVILGVPSSEAFARLDRGELRGTRAEAELTSLRFFLEPPKP